MNVIQNIDARKKYCCLRETDSYFIHGEFNIRSLEDTLISFSFITWSLLNLLLKPSRSGSFDLSAWLISPCSRNSSDPFQQLKEGGDAY